MMDAAASAGDGDFDVRFRANLRFGGWVGLTDDALLLVRDDERIRVAFDDVAQVTVETYDYFLAALSAVLVGFGLWHARRDPRALLFSLAGVASGYLVYRRRGKVTVHVRNRPKPLVLYPESVSELQSRLGPAIAPEDEDTGETGAAG